MALEISLSFLLIDYRYLMFFSPLAHVFIRRWLPWRLLIVLLVTKIVVVFVAVRIHSYALLSLCMLGAVSISSAAILGPQRVAGGFYIAPSP